MRHVLVCLLIGAAASVGAAPVAATPPPTDEYGGTGPCARLDVNPKQGKWDVFAQGPTSCELAINTGRRFLLRLFRDGSAPRVIHAYSSVTRRTYRVRCKMDKTGYVSCDGPNGISVTMLPY